MTEHHQPGSEPMQSPIYQIRIEGHLGSHWHSLFDGLSICLADNGETLLTGPVADQAALHGLLRRIRDSGMTLVSVRRLRSGQPDS